MKKNRSEKDRSNISKNLYCVILENAGERTQGTDGLQAEGSTPKRYSLYTK